MNIEHRTSNTEHRTGTRSDANGAKNNGRLTTVDEQRRTAAVMALTYVGDAKTAVEKAIQSGALTQDEVFWLDDWTQRLMQLRVQLQGRINAKGSDANCAKEREYFDRAEQAAATTDNGQRTTDNLPANGLRGLDDCRESEKNPPKSSDCCLGESAPAVTGAYQSAGAPLLKGTEGTQGTQGTQGTGERIVEQESFERLEILFLMRERRLTFDEIDPRDRALALTKGWIRKEHHNDTHFIPAGALAEAIGA